MNYPQQVSFGEWQKVSNSANHFKILGNKNSNNRFKCNILKQHHLTLHSECEVKCLKEAGSIESVQVNAKWSIYFRSSCNWSFSCSLSPAKPLFSHPVTGKKNLSSPLRTSLTDLGGGRCAVYNTYQIILLPHSANKPVRVLHPQLGGRFFRIHPSFRCMHSSSGLNLSLRPWHLLLIVVVMIA